jgi:hypothetical protein
MFHLEGTMHAPRINGWSLLLAFLVLLGAAALSAAPREPARRRLEKCRVDRAPEFPVVRWLGRVCGRLWSEFYYWTVGELDGPAASTASGFYLSEVPAGWYAYRVRAEGSENGPLQSDLR